MRSLTLLALAGLASSASAHTWFAYNGHEYALTSMRTDWLSNQAEAMSVGGNLVTINDAAENEWLGQTFANTYLAGYEGVPVGAAAHIGYYFNPTNSAWGWISGEDVTYTRHAGQFPQGGIHAYLHVLPHPDPYVWNANPFHTEPGQGALGYGIIERVPAPGAGGMLAIGAMIGLRRRRSARAVGE